MKLSTTEVLVIGGGATGTGILRDLAMRGIKAILVEKRDLSHGTTGRYHGLLHSGGRYVVKDPQAARECILENKILRHIMPFCIEDTGGFFVTTPWDDAAYSDRFLKGCQAAGIPVQEISPTQMLREEPRLNPQISRCFRVPDASADSFLAAEANAASAVQYGAQVLTYHEVRRLIVAGNQVRGALCYDLVSDEEVEISADLVINASGAWAGKIAATAGIEVQIKPGKGVMVAVNHRILNTVVNRCKLPSDGDIIVPAHTVAVIGTTDVQVSDPDSFAIEPWEIQLMLEEGEKLIPGFKLLRMLRAWAGVRPLYQETVLSQSSASRDITRAYVLLDHEKRDGVAGLVTITSGKWTTYRMMAEATVDKACEKLGIQRPCRTQDEPLPAPGDASHHGYHWLGARLAEIEREHAYGSLVCECELATRPEIERAIRAGAHTLDDIRRETRLGMGPCQGGFCTFRVAGILHQTDQPPARARDVQATNAALRDFLQERWKGLLPVLWGQQLRQERLDELIYLNVLNLPGAPGPQASRLAAENYARPQEAAPPLPVTEIRPPFGEAKPTLVTTPPLDVLIIGAGMAGLMATWQLASRGARVRCISKGWSALFWGSGCIDILGSLPGKPPSPVLHLEQALQEFVKNNPGHPYALAGLDQLAQAVSAIQSLSAALGYPLHAVQAEQPLAENWLLPTALGALRATCLAPQTMIAGDCRQNNPMVLVSFAGYPDFYPHLAAANLTAQGIPAFPLCIDLPEIRSNRMLTSRNLALQFQEPIIREKTAAAIQEQIHRLQLDPARLRIGFPAVLGVEANLETWEAFQKALEAPIFEIPGLPPSLPGMRLHKLFVRAIEKHHGRVFDGMEAQSIETAQSATGGIRIERVWSESAARPKYHTARAFILATGGILGGGLKLEPDQSLVAKVLELPLLHPATADSSHGLQEDFFHLDGHPIFKSGFQVDRSFQPCDSTGQPYFENLQAIGGALGGADPIRERSLEGIAIASAWRAAAILADRIPLHRFQGPSSTTP
jgi:glycerol-3-phosphate dehydrogenase